MITFTTPKPLPANITRWEVDDWEPHERAGWGIATIIMHTPTSTDLRVRRQIYIRNGLCDRIGYVANVGSMFADLLQVTEAVVSLPTGFTDAYAAYRGGAGQGGRNNALELWLLANGLADATMAGA